MKRNFTFISICLVFILTFTATSIFADENQYKIGSGDILDITTWKEPDFSREEILVRIDGMISFPLLDDVRAADRTTLELKKDIQTKLKGFVSNPIVTVNVRSPASKRIYILGE
ncbi:MAG: polysaccharide export protein, partial [Deltaproteobacteria bacterium]|nr:polysaccharide export protein [Deltaproteobacteria bacterium]